MSFLHVVPDSSGQQTIDVGVPDAITTIEELASGDNDICGPAASLIYLEGDFALYLDEHDTAEALKDATERDLVLIESLLNLAIDRAAAERRRRAMHRHPAGSARRISDGATASGFLHQ